MLVLFLALPGCSLANSHTLLPISVINYDFSVRYDREEEGLQGLHLWTGRGARAGQGGHEEGSQVRMWQRKFYLVAYDALNAL